MGNLEILEALQAAHNEYFSLMMRNYPTNPSDGLFVDFGPPEMCELAIEVQACAIALGSSALVRLEHLGLSILYPFDNAVDLYNWRRYVKVNRIDHATYASIAIRIDSELKRLRRTLELGGGLGYEALPKELFIVSKDRYKSNTNHDSPNPAAPPLPPTNISIETVNISNSIDSDAINELERLEKKTTIWSNLSNIIGALRGVLGG